MTIQPMSPLIGRTFNGRYEILSLLGEGGMAQVYQARHIQLDRLVAVKVMLPHLTHDATFAQRFEREAQLIAQLRHPHIIQVYDFDADPAQQLYYMVIELLSGPSLAQLMQTRPPNTPLPVDETLGIIRDVADALNYAHQRGMIHRDIKPGNVMLDGTRIVLTDFGLARLFDSAASNTASLTATGILIGTPAYMSPEQVMGIADDGRSDLYSLGVMFYELVTNKLPFSASTPLAMAVQQVNTLPTRPLVYDPALSPAIESVILRLMDKDPAKRYSTAAMLLIDLNHLDRVAPFDPAAQSLAGSATIVLPISHSALGTAPLKTSRFSPRPLITALLLTIVAIGLIGLAAIVNRNSASTGSSPTVAAGNPNCVVSLLANTPSLELKQGPGLMFQVVTLAVLHPGEVVMVIGSGRDMFTGNSWWKVRKNDAHEGWLQKTEVTDPGNCPVPTIYSSPAESPSLDGSPIGSSPLNVLSPFPTASDLPLSATATPSSTATAVLRPIRKPPTLTVTLTSVVPPVTNASTDVPPTGVPPTEIAPTDVPPTDVPTDVPPTDVPLTDVPTDVPPTGIPPTDVPPTDRLVTS